MKTIRTSSPRMSCPCNDGVACHFRPMPGDKLETLEMILRRSRDVSDARSEVLRIFTVDRELRMLHSEDIPGGCSVVGITPGALFQQACADDRLGNVRVGGVILVHNHPDGNLLPSREDVRATALAIAVGKLLRFELLDHCIVHGEHILSLREHMPKLWRNRHSAALFGWLFRPRDDDKSACAA